MAVWHIHRHMSELSPLSFYKDHLRGFLTGMSAYSYVFAPPEELFMHLRPSLSSFREDNAKIYGDFLLSCFSILSEDEQHKNHAQLFLDLGQAVKHV